MQMSFIDLCDELNIHIAKLKERFSDFDSLCEFREQFGLPAINSSEITSPFQTKLTVVLSYLNIAKDTCKYNAIMKAFENNNGVETYTLNCDYIIENGEIMLTKLCVLEIAVRTGTYKGKEISTKLHRLDDMTVQFYKISMGHTKNSLRLYG